MNRTVGIIAPLIDTRQYNVDFNLRLKRNNRELTLAAFYELAAGGFKPWNVNRGIDHEEGIPAAGFYLEGLLHENGYDTVLTNKFNRVALSSIASHDPIAVCVSTTMIISTESLLELFSSIRAQMPGTCIIAGGILIWKNYLFYQNQLGSDQHYHLEPWMLFHPDHSRLDADVLVVAPHGRESLLMVLKELEKGRGLDFGHIPNLALPGKDAFTFTKHEQERVDYNEDFTRWDLINEVPEKLPFRTSIGCPYRCRFCDFCQLYPSIFLRSKESLSKELKLMKDRIGQNPAIIHVSDDNVFINKKRLHQVCESMENSGFKYWMGFMRADEYTDVEMDAIIRSGLILGMIGVESGDPGQLKRMNKQQDIEKVRRGIEQFDANGISTLMTFVVGFPGENEDSLQNTAKFLNSLTLTNLLSNYQLYPLSVFPLSELADPAVRQQWKIEGFMDKWTHFSMNSDMALQACYGLFRDVTEIPYHYFEESHFFNRAMFNLETRKALFQLRHKLTINLFEKNPWNNIEPILRKMAGLMELSGEGIHDKLLEEIIIAG